MQLDFCRFKERITMLPAGITAPAACDFNLEIKMA